MFTRRKTFLPCQSLGQRRTWYVSASAVRKASSPVPAGALSSRTHPHGPAIKSTLDFAIWDVSLYTLNKGNEKRKRRKKTKKKQTHQQTLKSSLAWAPLLSFLCSAELMVWTALSIRFCSSSVSTRSVFHTIPKKTHPTTFVATLWAKRT